MIVGLDTEVGVRPTNVSHGNIADWCNIINTGLLANVTNGKSDILVIGGGKWFWNDVRNFWNQVSSCLGRNISYKHRRFFWNSIADINSVDFNDYALVVVATDHGDASGHLDDIELNALNFRKNDIADFLCRGGALFASSCEYNNPYGYISKLGSVNTFSETYNNITPTTEGAAIGITNSNLDIGPWHIGFVSFPSYLRTLATNDNKSIAAIGGKNVSVTTAAYTLPKTEFCLADPIIADASTSIGVANYFWSVQESDINWNRYGVEVNQWFTGVPSSINLTDFTNSKGLQFKCNTYYRIKLAVSGLCTDWIETTKLIKITCPNVTAGPDKCLSCSKDGSTTQLGQGNSTAVSYIWSPSIGLNNPNIGSPIHTNGVVPYPITYTVTATGAGGCKNSDQVTIFCQKPTIEITTNRHCCGIKLNSQAQNYQNLVWSSGEKDVPEIDVHIGGTYTVTATNPCGTVTQSITVPGTSVLTGFFNPIAYNSKFYPPSGGSGLKDKLYIMDVINGNGASGIPNSYNATEYKLEIYNRWGNLFKTIEGSNCNGFNNWTINWDGTDQNGNIVQQGQYVWKLYFKNCQYKEWTFPKERRFAKQTCLECKFSVFNWSCGFMSKCKKWDPSVPTTEDVIISSGSVTLVQ